MYEHVHANLCMYTKHEYQLFMALWFTKFPTPHPNTVPFVESLKRNSDLNKMQTREVKNNVEFFMFYDM